uniref:RNA-dependent RNA polymerase n=1 Tax=Nanning tick virus 2 TaxID=2972366 RepID=A0A9E8A9G3_9VIRU|nr:MAG: RNA-dependent RNA polymerase [Nanning tick virus 2]
MAAALEQYVAADVSLAPSPLPQHGNNLALDLVGHAGLRRLIACGCSPSQVRERYLKLIRQLHGKLLGQIVDHVQKASPLPSVVTPISDAGLPHVVVDAIHEAAVALQAMMDLQPCEPSLLATHLAGGFQFSEDLEAAETTLGDLLDRLRLFSPGSELVQALELCEQRGLQKHKVVSSSHETYIVGPAPNHWSAAALPPDFAPVAGAILHHAAEIRQLSDASSVLGLIKDLAADIQSRWDQHTFEKQLLLRRGSKDDLTKINGFCWLRLIPRKNRRKCALNFGPNIPGYVLMLLASYAAGPLMFLRYPNVQIERVEALGPSNLVHLGPYEPSDLLQPELDLPTVSWRNSFVGGKQGLNRVLTELSSTVHRDAAYQPYLQSVAQAQADTAFVNPYAIPDELVPVLERHGIPCDSLSSKHHEHAAHKAIENHLLYNKVAPLLSQDTTVAFTKQSKFERLQAVSPAPLQLLNVSLTPRDLDRYQHADFSSAYAPFKVSTPFLFLHDVGHYLEPANLHTLFMLNPNLQRVYFTAVLPHEASTRGPSYYPSLYQLHYTEESYVYQMVEGGGSTYVHPYHSLDWLTYNSISATYSLRNELENFDHGVEVLDSVCSHRLVCVTRDPPPILPSHAVYRSIDLCDLKGVNRMGDATGDNLRVPHSLVVSMYLYARGLKTLCHESMMAKARQLSKEPAYSHLNTREWTQVCYTIEYLAKDKVNIAGIFSASTRLRRWLGKDACYWLHKAAQALLAADCTLVALQLLAPFLHVVWFGVTIQPALFLASLKTVSLSHLVTVPFLRELVGLAVSGAICYITADLSGAAQVKTMLRELPEPICPVVTLRAAKLNFVSTRGCLKLLCHGPTLSAKVVRDALGSAPDGIAVHKLMLAMAQVANENTNRLLHRLGVRTTCLMPETENVKVASPLRGGFETIPLTPDVAHRQVDPAEALRANWLTYNAKIGAPPSPHKLVRELLKEPDYTDCESAWDAQAAMDSLDNDSDLSPFKDLPEYSQVMPFPWQQIEYPRVQTVKSSEPSIIDLPEDALPAPSDFEITTGLSIIAEETSDIGSPVATADLVSGSDEASAIQESSRPASPAPRSEVSNNSLSWASEADAHAQVHPATFNIDSSGAAPIYTNFNLPLSSVSAGAEWFRSRSFLPTFDLQQTPPAPQRNACALTAAATALRRSRTELQAVALQALGSCATSKSIEDNGLPITAFAVWAYHLRTRFEFIGDLPAEVPRSVGMKRTMKGNGPHYVRYDALRSHWESASAPPLPGSPAWDGRSVWNSSCQTGQRLQDHVPQAGQPRSEQNCAVWRWLPAKVFPERARAYAGELKQGLVGTLKKQEGHGMPKDFTSSMDAQVDAAINAVKRTGKRRSFGLSMKLGGPGSGKSYGVRSALLAMAAERLDKDWLVVCPKTSLRAKWKQDLGTEHDAWRVSTFETALHRSARVLIVDEFTQLPPGWLDLYLVTHPLTDHVLLLGDCTQGSSHEISGLSNLNALPDEFRFRACYAEFYLNYTMRLAPGVAQLVGIQTSRNDQGGVHLIDRPRRGTPVLVASSAADQGYRGLGYDSYTFSQAQGQDYKGDWQLVCDNAAVTTSSAELLLCAASRGKGNLWLIRSSPSARNANSPRSAAASQLLGFMAPRPWEVTFAHRLDNLRLIFLDGTSRAPLVRGGTELPIDRASHELQALLDVPPENFPEIAFKAQGYHPDPGPATHLWETDVNYIMESFAVEQAKEFREYRHPDYGVSDQFSDDDLSKLGFTRSALSLFPRQRSSDLATAAAAVSKRLRFSSRASNVNDLRRKSWLGPLMFDSLCQVLDLPDEPEPLDELLYSQCIYENAFNKLTNKTRSTLENNRDRADADWRATFVRIFIKGQLKVKPESLLSPFKAGQTLASFQDSVILVTGPMTRYLLCKIKQCAPANIMLNSGLSPYDMSGWAQQFWNDRAISTSNDFSEYDQSQTGDALSLEICLLRHYSLPPSVIDYYVESKLDLSCQFGHLAIERFTGEGPTWLFNTLFNVAISGLRYGSMKGVPQAYSGDDSSINAALRDTAAWPALSKHFEIRFKVERQRQAVFCGWILTSSGVCKEPRILLCKYLIAVERGNLHLVEESLAYEAAVGYHLGDALHDNLDDVQLSAQGWLVRRLVISLRPRFALLFSTASIADFARKLPAEAAKLVRSASASFSGSLWPLRSAIARAAVSHPGLSPLTLG